MSWLSTVVSYTVKHFAAARLSVVEAYLSIPDVGAHQLLRALARTLRNDIRRKSYIIWPTVASSNAR